MTVVSVGYSNGDRRLFHYTDDKGYKAINSQAVWLFKTSKPPTDRPKAVYFTTLAPGTPNLGKRLFIRGCAEKTEFVFSFAGGKDLRRLPGGRGEFIRYSENDYAVARERQGAHGETRKVAEELA